MFDGIGAVILLFIFLFVYFLPSIIAARSNRDNVSSIFVINLIIGWSIIGWFIVLAWGLSNPKPDALAAKPESVSQKPKVNELISDLQKLKENGIISEEEFNKKKTEILLNF